MKHFKTEVGIVANLETIPAGSIVELVRGTCYGMSEVSFEGNTFFADNSDMKAVNL